MVGCILWAGLHGRMVWAELCGACDVGGGCIGRVVGVGVWVGLYAGVFHVHRCMEEWVGLPEGVFPRGWGFSVYIERGVAIKKILHPHVSIIESVLTQRIFYFPTTIAT